ncbi:MAG: short-chain dehydrogenase [Rhodobacterales bacterium]|nr:MAG: short-chain dehydrogenase [Rhodobacterales bacterium]
MTQRSILITGASSGIGHDAALTLASQGWRVFATVRREEDRAPLDQAGITSLLMDYTDDGSIHAALEAVLARTGGTLDALYNNGAHAIPGALEDLPTDALRAIFEANFFGWHTLTRAVIPVMRAQGHGRIVNCSSVLGFVASPWKGAYIATKFALEGLTDTLRMEMADTPIHVILLQPGPIGTPFRANSIPHFERYVNWRESPRRAQYEGGLLKRLYDPGPPPRFELPPSAATRQLIRALEAERPRARYQVTVPTRIAGALRRFAPPRLLDRVLSRS